jgi:hypothetical protein
MTFLNFICVINAPLKSQISEILRNGRYLFLGFRIPDEEAGELPCAYVVRREGTDINEIHVMDFVGKQVLSNPKP